MRCEDCKHWTETFWSKQYNSNPKNGICDKLQYSGKLSISISAGWNGGLVDDIETEGDFFCAEFAPRPTTEGGKK